MVTIEDRASIIREVLDETRGELDGFVLLELEDVLDRLGSLIERDPLQIASGGKPMNTHGGPPRVYSQAGPMTSQATAKQTNGAA